MNRLTKRFLSICLAFAISFLSIFSTDFTYVNAGTDSSGFDDLDQKEITEAMGAGWNLGNQLESSSNGTPSETVWGNPKVTKALIQAVKAQGFSTIRIPVSYLNYIGDKASGYEIDADWLARIHEVVDYAIDEGLYVVINIHGDGYTTVTGSWLLCNASDQTEIQAKYAAVWKQIANEFKDYDEHLIFESMNEEFDGTYGTPNATYYSNINAYNQIFVNTVRQTGGNNAKRWLIVCGWNTDITYTCGNYGFEIPEDKYLDSSITEPRLMISVHYYTPWDFCGGGTQTTYSYTSGGWDDPYANIKKCYTSFVSKGYPVFIGEYGATNMGNESDRIAFVTDVCTAARQYGCIPVIWDNGGTGTGTDKFALFNRKTYAVTQQGIIDAIMDVFSSAVAAAVPDATKISSVTNTSSGVKITWSKVSDATGYYVYRKTGSSGTYSKIAAITNSSTVSYTNKKSGSYAVSSGKTYYYKVYAYSSSGTSAASSAKSIRYLTAGKVSSLTNTTTGIKVKWSKVTGATGYYIYRKVSGGSYSRIKTIASGSTVSYTDTAVKNKNGTKYYYYVIPYYKSSSGTITKGYHSNTKTMVRLKAVTLSSVKNSSSKKMTVKWTKNSKATGYQIQYSTSKSFSTYSTKTVSGASSVKKTISSLKKGKTYYVRIRVYRKVGSTKYYSAWSSKKSVKISK